MQLRSGRIRTCTCLANPAVNQKRLPFRHRKHFSRLHISGGVGEIRTHGTIARTTPFQGVTIGLSVTTPLIWRDHYFSMPNTTFGR